MGWMTEEKGRTPMRSPGRPRVNQRAIKQAFWNRIAEGLRSEAAAVTCGVSQPLGPRWCREAGGMEPISLTPPSGRYLPFSEREELALLKAEQLWVREMARRLGRAPSTISLELPRNAATRGGTLQYRVTIAQWKAKRATTRPKAAKLAENGPLRTYVQAGLAGAITHAGGRSIPGPNVPWKGRHHGHRADRRWGTCWNPEQISQRLRVDFPHDETMRNSHETICQALYIQGRGALRRELTVCLRTGRALRVPQRPTVPCPVHWEGDLILGLNSSAIGTLVERTTRLTMLLHLPPVPGYRPGARVKNGPALAGHGAEAVRDAIATKIVALPEQLRQSLTWDQGRGHPGARHGSHDRAAQAAEAALGRQPGDPAMSDATNPARQVLDDLERVTYDDIRALAPADRGRLIELMRWWPRPWTGARARRRTWATRTTGNRRASRVSHQ